MENPQLLNDSTYVVFSTTCPLCRAPSDAAELSVVSASVELTGVRLEASGFDLHTADHIETDNVLVRCSMCDTVFSLEKCLLDAPCRICNGSGYVEDEIGFVPLPCPDCGGGG